MPACCLQMIFISVHNGIFQFYPLFHEIDPVNILFVPQFDPIYL